MLRVVGGDGLARFILLNQSCCRKVLTLPGLKEHANGSQPAKMQHLP